LTPRHLARVSRPALCPTRYQRFLHVGFRKRSVERTGTVSDRKDKHVDNALRCTYRQVRRQMRLPPREGAPAARRNWEVPPTITTKEALFGGSQKQTGGDRRRSDYHSEPEVGRRKKVQGVVEVSRVPRNEAARRRSKAGAYASPYDAEIQTRATGRMERIPSSNADRMVFYD